MSTARHKPHENNFDPVDTVTRLIQAVNQGDLETVVACHETDATLIVQPGRTATGTQAIREAYAGFIAMQMTITSQTHKTIQAGASVLFISKWTATGIAPDGTTVNMGGTSSDVLRRQSDGRWLIAIDNPFGAAILD